MAREWFGGILKDWFGGERARPAPLPRASPRRDLRFEAPDSEQPQRELDQFEGTSDGPERRQLEGEAEKNRLLERLRQKQQLRKQENRATD
jgi:hypothetical protein